jgi:glycosidase
LSKGAVASKIRGKRWVALVSVAALLLTCLQAVLYPNLARAADVFSVNPATAAGLVDQDRSELAFGAMSVGQVKTDRVFIQNKGDRALSFVVFARFSYTSSDGQNTLITDSTTDPYDMADWALFGTNKVAAYSVSVLPGKSVVVPVQITVPKDAYPGTHSAAIVVATTISAGTVVVAKRVALYMSAQVPGDLKPAANPSWVSDSVFYEANVRQLSATKNFAGATARMDDLKALGVEGLILDPIFPIGKSKMVGTLGSVYAPTDLSTVNPSLGTIANFKSLKAAAKTNGLKLILTVPIEFAAIDHPWVVDHPNWFKRDLSYNLVSDPAAPYLAEYDYSQPELRQAVIEELLAWVVEQDVDGFMLAGATDVPVSFLNELTYRLKATKDLLIGTTEAQKNPYFVNSLTLSRNDALRVAMETIDDGLSKTADYNALVSSLNNDFTAPTLALNHLSSYATMLDLKTETARFGAALGTAAALTFTLPGAPMIFQGQEVGSIKALKPYDADNIVWPAKLPAGYTTYQQLIKMKKANEALFNEKYGAAAVPLTTSSTSLFAFKRTKNKSNVIVVVNLSKKALTAKFNPGVAATMYAFTTDKAVKLTTTNTSVTIPALGYEIFTATLVK